MSWNNSDGPWGSGDKDNNSWIKKPKRDQKDSPNLEELLKKGQDNYKKFFPNNGKGGKNGGGGKTLWYIAGGIFFLWLLTGIYTVQQDEQAAILRIGKWLRTTDPGLNYHLPTPIESAQIRNVTSINIF